VVISDGFAHRKKAKVFHVHINAPNKKRSPYGKSTSFIILAYSIRVLANFLTKTTTKDNDSLSWIFMEKTR
jgi:hypothetical protein